MRAKKQSKNRANIKSPYPFEYPNWERERLGKSIEEMFEWEIGENNEIVGGYIVRP